jgi:hypothetical protein
VKQWKKLLTIKHNKINAIETLRAIKLIGAWILNRRKSIIFILTISCYALDIKVWWLL